MPGDHPTGAIAAVLPAAGDSSRLGTNKLLIELDGESLVRRAARRALEAELDPVVVVVGHEAEAVRRTVADLPVVPVLNARPARGLPSSLRVGIDALPADIEAAVVLLPDMPLVTAAMLRAMVERWRAERPRLVVSRYGEAWAPPVLYSRALFPALIESTDGGRGVIRAHRDEAVSVRWPVELLVDLDLPSDLARIRGSP
ncbi:MAG TPA: nucleotidyltransferase family protein [Gemmatimonadales bacterium]|nr:nucleotidyltransferase family protein [Gemmatimonadales bacterium]